MQKYRPVPRRQYADHLIVLCVRSYLRYCLTLRLGAELKRERICRSFPDRTLGRYAPN